MALIFLREWLVALLIMLDSLHEVVEYFFLVHGALDVVR